MPAQLQNAKAPARDRLGRLLLSLLALSSMTQTLGAAPQTPVAAVRDSLYRESRPALGTDVQIILYADDAETASALFELAFEEIERVEQLLSTYRSTSELSRINREAPQGPVYLDGEMTRLLQAVFSWSRRSDGAFDASVGALLDVWGFRSARSELPSEDELRHALSRVGMDRITFSATERTIAFSTEGLWLDSGGFGKGYALDCAAAKIEQHGVERALLEAGQSTYVALDPPPLSSGWLISISDPDSLDSVLDTVSLHRAALSTSGRSARRVLYGDRAYAHIIDPRSGFPVDRMKVVTVVAHNGLMSDILSTASFVKGFKSGTAFLESVPGTRGILLEGSGTDRRVSKIQWDKP